MAKWPVFGRVKTRLGLPPEPTLRLYRAFLEDTIRSVDRACDEGYLSVGGGTLAQAQLLLPAGLRRPWQAFVQRDGHLGERMGEALENMGSSRSVVTGSDLPTLQASDLEAVFEALEEGQSRRAVVLPSSDGGYSALGLRGSCPELLTNHIPWSSSTVLDASRRAAREAGIEWAELHTVDDIDTPDDLQGLIERLPEGAKTRQVLQELSMDEGRT